LDGEVFVIHFVAPLCDAKTRCAFIMLFEFTQQFGLVLLGQVFIVEGLMRVMVAHGLVYVFVLLSY